MKALIWLDYVMVLAVLAYAVAGGRRGLSRTAAGTIAVLVALAGAILSAGNLTPLLAQRMQGALADALQEELGHLLPAGAQAVSAAAAGALLTAVQDTILKTVVFTIAFLLLLLLWMCLCDTLDVAAYIPKVKRFNPFFGALCGAVKGAVMVLTIVYILFRMGIVPETAVNTSLLLKHLSKLFTL